VFRFTERHRLHLLRWLDGRDDVLRALAHQAELYATYSEREDPFGDAVVAATAGRTHNPARLVLDGNTAAILRRAGFTCSGAEKGTLALVLGTLYQALGIRVPRRLGAEAKRAVRLDPRL
jgi:hypothetical protein